MCSRIGQFKSEREGNLLAYQLFVDTYCLKARQADPCGALSRYVEAELFTLAHQRIRSHSREPKFKAKARLGVRIVDLKDTVYLLK